MGKVMAIGGMIVAGLITLAFALDMLIGIPFQGADFSMDLGFAICGVILGYLSFNAFRDAR